MKKQFIAPGLHLISINKVFTTEGDPTMASSSFKTDDNIADAPGRGKSPVPTSVNQVLSQTADQK